MGMYDTVYATCPNCMTTLEWQSKAGDCVLDSFNKASVPIKIAEAIQDQIANCACGTKAKLKPNLTIPLRICMHTEIVK
jgi:hypothetical protein